MEPTKCLHEDAIKRVAKDMYGNGGKGMVKEFESYKTMIKVMDERSKRIETSLSGINKFVGTVETELVNIKSEMDNKRQSTTQTITQVLMIAGILASIVIGLL